MLLLNVVADLWALMTLDAIRVGPMVPGGFSCAGYVLGERPDELQQLARQVVGWAMGQRPVPT